MENQTNPNHEQPSNNPQSPDHNRPQAIITVADIRADMEMHIKKWKEEKGLFMVKPARQWMEEARNKPTPKMLFDKFWFEGELCILFADTNLGKSILAVQIGNSISSGEPIPGFELESEAQPILYFDFEMSDKQFELRYSTGDAGHYDFNDQFIRVEINPDAMLPDDMDFENYLNLSLVRSIEDTGAKVLIIDNLTYLKNETEKAKDALPLMKHLKDLKSRYGLSMLALAHTPKRDPTKPITRNDLQGSKMLINFCDSAFAIGESHTDKTLRYLKQIKQRNTEQVYDAGNVCICRVEKPQNFLQFEFVKFDAEGVHLRQRDEMEREEMERAVAELHELGKSFREIGEELGITKARVQRLLNKSK